MIRNRRNPGDPYQVGRSPPLLRFQGTGAPQRVRDDWRTAGSHAGPHNLQIPSLGPGQREDLRRAYRRRSRSCTMGYWSTDYLEEDARLWRLPCHDIHRHRSDAFASAAPLALSSYSSRRTAAPPRLHLLDIIVFSRVSLLDLTRDLRLPTSKFTSHCSNGEES